MQTQIEKSERKIHPEQNNISTMDRNGIISTFESHEKAEDAIKQLQKSGYDMKKISLVGRDFQTEESVIGFYNMGDRAKYWGKLGAFWGGLWGLLFGSALFIVPGIGPLVIAGSFISSLVGAAEGIVVVGGLSALGAALFSIGIPKDSVVQYEAEVKAGKYIMIAHGTMDDLKSAREIVKNSGARNIADFSSVLANSAGIKH